MFGRHGIVTSIWAKRMERGDRFEDLAVQFGDNGFKHMEVRDRDYLRNSEFGSLIQKIEAAMAHYTDDQWKTICNTIRIDEGWGDHIKMGDRSLFDRMSEFVGKTKDLVLSYAISHPWLSQPKDVESDNQRMIQAMKLAYLLCPHQARLRLADYKSTGEVDPLVVIENFERFRSLLSSYPIVFAVENALQPATVTLDLAVQAGALLTYDEANTYLIDGTTRNIPEAFWNVVEMENLTSIHLKQKTTEGVLSQVGDGFVDFVAIVHRLKERGYMGDLLFENAPTYQPLEDAIQSREYLYEINCKSSDRS